MHLGSVNRIIYFGITCVHSDEDEVELLGEDGEIHLLVLELQQQIQYLLHELQTAHACWQSAVPGEQQQGEAVRQAANQRFTAIEQVQKDVMEAINKEEQTASEPDAVIAPDPEDQKLMEEDKNTILAQIQQLQGLGYQYTTGIPGQISPRKNGTAIWLPVPLICCYTGYNKCDCVVKSSSMMSLDCYVVSL